MATYRAVGATCEAVVRLLQQSWQPAMFNGTDLLFEVYRTKDFATPMKVGVSLFLYRVSVNTVQRTPRPRPDAQGRQRLPQLPLDLHFLLTPWAEDASLEQIILGWLMRTIESTCILPSGLLNSMTDGIFDENETVEIVVGQLSNEEMFRIWDVLPNDYQISVPYTARIVRIDSDLVDESSPVVIRELDFGALKDL